MVVDVLAVVAVVQWRWLSSAAASTTTTTTASLSLSLDDDSQRLTHFNTAPSSHGGRADANDNGANRQQVSLSNKQSSCCECSTSTLLPS